jgi:hypothetical protein
MGMKKAELHSLLEEKLALSVSVSRNLPMR